MKPENPRSCNRVMTMLDDKLGALAAQIQEMERFHGQLAGYRRQCDEALAVGDCCPVIMTVGQELEGEKS